MSDTVVMGDPSPPERPPLTFRPPTPSARDRLRSGLDYWRDALAYLIAILTPIIAYVGNLGFAPLASLLGIGALVFLGRKSAPSIGVAILFALLAWALASMSWSPAMPIHPDFHRYKNVEALTGLKLVFELGLYASFVFALRRVSEGAAARASLVLAAGLALMAVLLVIEAFDGAALYQWIKAAVHNRARPDLAMRNVARACYVATVLFWPAVLRLQRAHLPLLTAVFVLGLGASLAVFKLDAPILALILAALVFLGVQRFGRGVIWALIGAVVVYFAAAPLVAHFVTGLIHPHDLPGQVGKHSWAERLDIWRFVSAEVLQNPIKGWGLDASRAWPADIPLHPHDAALQIWLELGALGAALAALFWAWLFIRIAAMLELDRTMAAAAAASATAYLTIGALSFGVWQEWWLAVGAVAIVVCGFVATSRQSDASQRHDLLELQPIG
jgi:O-antigen ligase